MPSTSRSGEHIHTTTPYRDAAAYYLSRGWAPLPVPAGAKWPPPEGYTGTLGAWPSADQVDEWVRTRATANVALRVPRDVVGLDIDAYDGHHGGETLARLVAQIGPLPATWITTSRADDPVSGIRWYRVPCPQALPGGLPPGIEIVQHRHRYGMAPPSRHPSGQSYRCRPPKGTNNDGGPTPRLPDVRELPVLPDVWCTYLRDQTHPATADTARATGSPVPRGDGVVPTVAPMRAGRTTPGGDTPRGLAILRREVETTWPREAARWPWYMALYCSARDMYGLCPRYLCDSTVTSALVDMATSAGMWAQYPARQMRLIHAQLDRARSSATPRTLAETPRKTAQ